MSSSLVPSVVASLPALIRWKSTVGTSRSAASGAETASATMRAASGPNGSRYCGLMVRVLRSVSWCVHSWSEMIPFHGSSTICSPSSMALARTTSSSAVRRATLPISLRYIRTGSSIPIMSAERASSSSWVGSSSASASSLTGTSPATRAPARTSSSTTSTPRSTASSSRASGGTTSSSSTSRSSSSSASSSSARRVRTPASLASSRSALRRPPPERATSTSCLSSGSVIGVLQRKRGGSCPAGVGRAIGEPRSDCVALRAVERLPASRRRRGPR